MIYLILLWFPFAAFAEYVLGLLSPPNILKAALYHLLTWPNSLMRAAQSLYGRNAYRFPKIAALTAWFKA